MAFDAKADNSPLAKVALTGFLINILNPKLSIFFLAFLPQFLPTETSAPVMHMLSLGGIFIAMTFVVFIAYGAFAAKIPTPYPAKTIFSGMDKTQLRRRLPDARRKIGNGRGLGDFDVRNSGRFGYRRA